MKPLALVALCLLILFRIGAWKERRNEILRFCNEAQAAAKTRKYPEIIGSLSFNDEGRAKIMVANTVGSGLRVGEVFLGRQIQTERLKLGQKVSISGPFRCDFSRRNPGRWQDGWHFFERPRISLSHASWWRVTAQPSDWKTQVRVKFLVWLNQSFSSAPGWRGLEVALWTGDNSGLPVFLREFYQEQGLQHFLALSGLRVMGLVLVLSFALKTLFWVVYQLWGPKRCGWYRYARRVLPLAACLVLALTANGPAPVVRMTAMWISYTVLSLRRFECGALQRVGSSVACLLLWEPELLANPGFIWSAVATVLLCEAMGEGRLGGAGDFVFLMLVMPVLVFPLSAFSSAKLALLSPLHSLVLGGIWEFGLIPMGYTAPFGLALMPQAFSSRCVPWLERGWQWVVAFHHFWQDHVPLSAIAVIRLTWLEMLIWEFLLLSLVSYGLRIHFNFRGRLP